MKTNFQVKDHSVSKELFTLRYDEHYHMYHTSPRPSLEKLPSYYNSKDYISHTDGKRSLFEFAYQTVKEITLSRKRKLLEKYHPGKRRVLDIGAGTGDFLKKLKSNGWIVEGIEPNMKARELAGNKGLKVQRNLSDLDDATFNVITLWHVLEHIYDLPGQIEWLKNHLRDEGTLFIAVPNFKSYDANHYKSFWAAYDVPRHLYHFSDKSIELLFQEKGFNLIETLPMKFDAYYVSLLSEKYKSGRSNFIKALWTGWKSNSRARHSRQYSSHIYVLKHANT